MWTRNSSPRKSQSYDLANDLVSDLTSVVSHPWAGLNHTQHPPVLIIHVSSKCQCAVYTRALLSPQRIFLSTFSQHNMLLRLWDFISDGFQSTQHTTSRVVFSSSKIKEENPPPVQPKQLSIIIYFEENQPSWLGQPRRCRLEIG